MQHECDNRCSSRALNIKSPGLEAKLGAELESVHGNEIACKLAAQDFGGRKYSRAIQLFEMGGGKHPRTACEIVLK
jgi:hypothetical protein